MRTASICFGYLLLGIALSALALFLLCAFIAPYDEGGALFKEVCLTAWHGWGF